MKNRMMYHPFHRVMADFPLEFPFQSFRHENDPKIIRPAADILEDKEGYEISLSLPGISKEDVNVELKDQVLTVQAERKSSDKEGEWLRQEIKSGILKRSFRLGESCAHENLQANMENGILCIRIPKIRQKPNESSRIPVL